jgi:hypothetical protein
MIKDEDDDGPQPDHNHKAVNAKTYCNQSKNKWKDLQTKAHQLDAEYDEKIKELGNLCS